MSTLTEKTKSFKKTAKEHEAIRLLKGEALSILLYGGSRSGKTFMLLYAIIVRALKHKSRHLVLRLHFNHVKTSVWHDTLPKVIELACPHLSVKWNRSDYYVEFPNGSEIWIGGLDDKSRTEKVLGTEYSTIFFNECSQLTYDSTQTALSRLAENSGLVNKAYYDCVSGDTILDGQTETIAVLARKGKPIPIYTSRGIEIASAPWMNGRGMMYLIETAAGQKIEITASHRVWTKEGWKRAENITIGQPILCSDERPLLCDVRGVPSQMRRVQDSRESCYKCRRQCGGLFLQAATHGLAYLASSFCEVRHSQSDRRDLRHDESSFYKAHQRILAIRHILHNPACHVLLFLEFFSQLVYMGRCVCLRAFELSQQICPFCQRSRVASYLSEPCQELHLAVPSSSASLPSDTPDESSCFFSPVVAVKQTTTKPFYTLEVPIARHYIAQGIVSHNCNPPNKKHWLHEMFLDGIEPEEKQPYEHPEQYASLLMNPIDNKENLPDGYIETILGGLSRRKRERFLLGLWRSSVEGALWSEDDILRLSQPPVMDRIVIGVDPATTSGEKSDETGIIVAGKSGDRFIVLEDLSDRYSPNAWANKVIEAYDEWQADCVVAEVNNGGDMVEATLRTADKNVSYQKVWATRKKAVRAEPIEALYEQKRCFHCGVFPELEDQMCSWEQGKTKKEMGFSPDRMDAMVWAATALMIKKGKKKARAF